MRIAIFSEVYWPMISGVAQTLDRTVQALISRGHSVRVYSARYALPAGVTDRPEAHRSPARPFALSPEVEWARPRQAEITADLAAFGPDVVHLATEFPMGRAGLKAARRLRVPIVASAHTDYESYAARYGFGWAVTPGWIYLRRFYRHAEVVLAPSRAYQEQLQRRGFGIPGSGAEASIPIAFIRATARRRTGSRWASLRATSSWRTSVGWRQRRASIDCSTHGQR